MTIAIQIIVDSSGSMEEVTTSGISRFRVAKNSIIQQLEVQYDSSYLWGIKTFSSFNNDFATLLPLGNYSLKELTSSIERIRITNFRTPLSQTIIAAKQELLEQEYSKRAILCFSDGEHNVSPPDMSKAFEHIRAGNVELEIGVEISLVNIGDISDEVAQEYQKEVSSIGGTYIDIPDGSETKEIEENITLAFEAVTTMDDHEMQAIKSTITGNNSSHSIKRRDIKISALEKKLKRSNFTGNFFSLVNTSLTLVLLFWIYSLSVAVEGLSLDIESFALSISNMWDLLKGNEN